MINTTKNLIIQLITTARARGISQAQLAEMAGITAVGLSKAKSRGDIRASTLVDLAAQLDMELILVPHRAGQQATDAIKKGAFFRTSATPDKAEEN